MLQRDYTYITFDLTRVRLSGNLLSCSNALIIRIVSVALPSLPWFHLQITRVNRWIMSFVLAELCERLRLRFTYHEIIRITAINRAPPEALVLNPRDLFCDYNYQINYRDEC